MEEFSDQFQFQTGPHNQVRIFAILLFFYRGAEAMNVEGKIVWDCRYVGSLYHKKCKNQRGKIQIVSLGIFQYCTVCLIFQFKYHIFLTENSVEKFHISTREICSPNTSLYVHSLNFCLVTSLSLHYGSVFQVFLELPYLT